MPRYRFELATAADDAELRELLAATPTDGHIAVSFRREPSYFGAAAVHGEFHQTIICRDTASGLLVGAGMRSARNMFVNGELRPIGYLSGLRVRPEYRNLGLIARGYRFFRELHADGRAPLYLTTIAEGNRVAQSILTSGRAGLPAYHDAGRFCTFVISPRRRGEDRADVGSVTISAFGRSMHHLAPVGAAEVMTARKSVCELLSPLPGLGEVSVRSGSHGLRRGLRSAAPTGAEDQTSDPTSERTSDSTLDHPNAWPALLDFWNTHGPRRQFFPLLTTADFGRDDATFRGLQEEDVLVAGRDGRIVGTLGVWDQTAFRQNIVERYSRPLSWLRPDSNAWAALRGGVRLPPIGQPFPHRVAALPVVADDDPAVFAELLEAARQRSDAHLLVGLHERDPLAAIARAKATSVYVTRLYHVGWDDGEALRMALDDRPPYLELGTL
jgi:hypothetical protein